MLPQLCYRYELSSASLQQFYITFMCKIALRSHCQIITLSMTQLFGNLWIFSSNLIWWTFGWNRNHSEKKGFNLAKKRTNNVLPAYILQLYTDVHWSFILLFSQFIFSFREPYVHYIALKKFWKRITTESHELSLECCWKENLQLKMAVSELNNSKILAQKIVKPSTLSNNNFVKILKWVDN